MGLMDGGFKYSRFYGLVGLNFFGYNGFMASNYFRVWISFWFDVFRCASMRLKSCHWWGKDLLRWGPNLAIEGAPVKVCCSTRNRTTSLTQKNLNQPRKLDFFALFLLLGSSNTNILVRYKIGYPKYISLLAISRVNWFLSWSNEIWVMTWDLGLKIWFLR